MDPKGLYTKLSQRTFCIPISFQNKTKTEVLYFIVSIAALFGSKIINTFYQFLAESHRASQGYTGFSALGARRFFTFLLQIGQSGPPARRRPIVPQSVVFSADSVIVLKRQEGLFPVLLLWLKLSTVRKSTLEVIA